jgi:hypothetical protein
LPSMTQSSPFGGAPPAPAPSGAGGGQTTFLGKSARELLVQFYQQKNPTKVAEVDKLLNKYLGNEELMFRNLAKKYQLDPSAFGLSPAPAPSGSFGSPQPGASPGGFGQSSVLGGGSTFGGGPSMGGGPSPFGGQSGGFGQASAMGAVAAPVGPAGAHTFGAGTATSGFGASGGFGNLAHSSSPSPFGAPSPAAGFGSPSPGFAAPSGGFGSASPFGAPRR